ncbi:MAG: ABC transporter substrate-binding protein [Dehalococcoidales bacterium]|nr:ABC transporter substrate-binding protein [Dehalococcoidales bacterium]
MKCKFGWVVVSCLMVLSLLIVSCEEKTEKTTTVDEGDDEVIITVTEDTSMVEDGEDDKVVEAPRGIQYGGTVKIATQFEPRRFDESHGFLTDATTMKLTHQELMMGDWTLGPAGTGKVDWAQGSIRRIDLNTGCIAENWEIPELGTVIFNIREGVEFALDPENEASVLVGGRTVTADDVIDTLTLYTTNFPLSMISMGDTRFATFEKLGDMTVKATLPVTAFDDVGILGDFASIVAPEIGETFGLPLDWRYSCGTGAFMLKDYVPSSSVLFEKSPNYWEKDPIGEGMGNDLPYLDGVKLLIIPDDSSRQAALRTAKVDILHGVGWENANELRKRTPDLMSKKYFAVAPGAIYMRTDKAETPYTNKDVRRALMMATDFETIKETYCGGEAQILSFPICEMKEYKDAYLPLEEAPASVQELYVYDTAKAKTLLTNAGYPDGFKTEIFCHVNSADYLAIIKDMWSKVNVDVTIVPHEGSVFTGISWGRHYEDMIYTSPGPVANLYLAYWYVSGPYGANASYVDDPVCVEAKDKMMRLSMIDVSQADAINKELMAYVLDQAWAIPAPATPLNNFWWPWVKNYHGEASLGYNNDLNYTKYIWMDTALKESMGY